MMIEIYHNPRCSKSRQTLSLLESKNLTPKVRLYLENPPTQQELQAALDKLGIEAVKLLRTKEDTYQELVAKHGKPNNQQALEWMSQHPKLIERPIVINQDKARIGRPPEAVLEIL